MMPSSGFVGPWKVAGMEFVADANTDFEQEAGAFAVGAYVEVEYSKDGAANRIHEIETEVPPGAGDDDDLDRIESKGASLATTAAGTTLWRIGGVDYHVQAGDAVDRGQRRSGSGRNRGGQQLRGPRRKPRRHAD